MQTDQHLPPLSYLASALVLLCLLILTAVTIAVAKIHLGPFNIVCILLIASIKSSLVLLYFMHLRSEIWAVKISLISTILVLAIFISFTFWDVAYR